MVSTPKCDVSVVVPCFNAERYLADALNSVWAQTVQPAEVIVVDDASTDRSVRIARQFGSRVRVIELDANHGFPAVAKGVGLTEARCQYVAFLDADDLWTPRKLERQLPAFSDPAVGLVYGRAQTFRTGHLPHGSPWPAELPTGVVITEFYFRCHAPNSTVVARRGALLDAGGFDPTVRICEDYDLWFRTALRCRVAAVPDVVMWYREHPHQQNHRRSVLLQAQFEVENRYADKLRGVTGISEAERQRRIVARLTGQLEAEFYSRNLDVVRIYADFIETHFADLDEHVRKRLRRLRRRTYWPSVVFRIRDAVAADRQCVAAT